MDQQPKIPTLKDAQKPQVKVKGMGAGLTLFDRLKQFKKKDLAFILAGLGTLFMAPLAEHFMMAPESGAELKGGFGGGQGGSGSNLFGSGSSPYENGNNSIAQGGAVGGAGDIITPLNVRDPSALVMGPGAAQQPPAGSAAPAVAPPTSAPAKETDYKDALAGAASRAASAAVKKSPLPIPKIAVGGSGLRGLGAASGGSSAGASLGPIGPAAGSTGSGGGGSLNLVKSSPNFRGVAGARGPGNPTGLDGTKKAGANAGDAFSRTGNALGGLNAAASEQIPTGAGGGFGGGGQGGAGANDKPGGGGAAPGSKSVGESLAFIEAKERMMENLKLEFEKRKLKDPELLLYGIRNDVLKASAGEVGKWITKGLMDGADKLLSPADPAADSLMCGAKSMPAKVTYVAGTGGAPGKGVFKDANNAWWLFDETGSKISCTLVPGAKGSPTNAEARGANGTGGVNGDQPIPDRNTLGDATNLKTACADLGSIMKPAEPKPETKPDGTTVVAAASGVGKVNDQAQASARFKEAAEYSTVKKALVGDTTDGCLYPDQNPKIAALTGPSVSSLQKEALDAAKTAVDKLKGGVKQETVEGANTYSALYKTAFDKADKARKALESVRTAAGDGMSNVTVGAGLKWSDATKNTGDNGRKLGAIENVLSTSRTDVSGKLKTLSEAQDTLEGAIKDVPASAPKDAAVAGLAGVVKGDDKGGAAVEGSPINLTQKTNADFKKYVDGLAGKPVDAPKTATAVTFTADSAGVTGNATTGKGEKSYDVRKAEADKAIQTAVETVAAVKAGAKTPEDETKDKKAANEAVTALKATVLGVQGAQSDWIDKIDSKVTEARSKVPGAAAAK